MRPPRPKENEILTLRGVEVIAILEAPCGRCFAAISQAPGKCSDLPFCYLSGRPEENLIYMPVTEYAIHRMKGTL